MLLTVLEYRFEEASREAWQGYDINDWPRTPPNHPRQECFRRLQATLHQLPPLLSERASAQLSTAADKFFYVMNNVIEMVGWSFNPIDASELVSTVVDMFDAPLPVGSLPWAKRSAASDDLPFADVGWVSPLSEVPD
jgi:hypothetical protein